MSISKSYNLDCANHRSILLNVINSLMLLLMVFLQFQNVINVYLEIDGDWLGRIVRILDKLIILVMFVFFLCLRVFRYLKYKNKDSHPRCLTSALLSNEWILFIILVAFVFWCFISSAVNGNDIVISMNGTFVYLSYIIVFFVFSSLPYTAEIIRRNYNVLLSIALFLSVVSIVQEILAFACPTSLGWWPNFIDSGKIWRCGIYRAPSLLGHPNTIGTCLLFFFTIEAFRVRLKDKKLDWQIIVLGLAIFFSISRSAIGCVFIVLFFLIGFRRKLLCGALIAGILVAAGVYFFNKSDKYQVYDSCRKFAMHKSCDIFCDHPVVGVGPGMYGGHISIKYDSPVYRQYGFPEKYFNYIKDVGSIEQQWMQILAELGLPGTIIFLLLLFSPVIMLFRLPIESENLFIRAMVLAFKVTPLQILLYGLGFTVTNLAILLVPYFAFVGMLVGMQRIECNESSVDK